SDGRPLWDSGTEGSGANQLVYQNDGNLVMYGPAAIRCYDPLRRVCDPKTAWNCSCVGGGIEAIWDTGTAGSPAGSFLVMQDDNNLVMYSPTGGVQWSAR